MNKKLSRSSKLERAGTAQEAQTMTNQKPAADLEPGWHFCHACQRYTQWTPLRRNSRRQKCSVCGDEFPCRHDCNHQDCQAFRRQSKAA
jgi:hypothetical protein